MGRVTMAQRLPIIATALGLLGGCGQTTTVAPPTIHFGQDVCAVCGMIISDERFAAGLVTEGPDGLEAHAFDDIGCLLEDEALHGDRAVAGRWVRDFRTRRWLEADNSVYVHSPKLYSPMAYGLAACGDEGSARVLLSEFPGELLEFAGVRTRFESDELIMPPTGHGDLPSATQGRER